MDYLSLKFAALSDPTRREMIRRLADRQLGLVELARPLPMSVPAVAKHLRVLEKAGLVRRGVGGRPRPAMLDLDALQETSDWIDAQRQFWLRSFARLDALLADDGTPDE